MRSKEYMDVSKREGMTEPMSNSQRRKFEMHKRSDARTWDENPPAKGKGKGKPNSKSGASTKQFAQVFSPLGNNKKKSRID